jgi:acyl-homoserine-lactone acylase
MRKSVIGLTAASAILALSACGNETGQTETKSEAKYTAEITMTEYGIPHITAADYASLGYGEGYVAARDHLCNIAHVVLRAKGELAQTFGAGANNSNLLSDYAVRGLGMPAKYAPGFAKQPDDVKDTLTGYAAGFNAYLGEYKTSGDNSHWCSGEDWVTKLTPLDMFARARFITDTLPRVGGGLYAAKPPQGDSAAVDNETLHAAAEAINQKGFGSNGWAIGRDLSENGGGMLLANPHYPWFGSNRFWEKHLTIPGKIDAYGVSLIGIPGVTLGFNKDVAWSHTVSNSQRIVIYRLTLSPDDPMSYIYEGETRKLETREFSIPVKGEDGNVSDMPATIYYSLHGPLIALPGMAWSENAAFAVRDANRDNDSSYAQWFDMSRADSMDSFKAAHERWNAIPWVNTIATSRDGQAAYIDNSSVGHLSDTAIAAWQAAYDAGGPIKAAYDRSNLVILDGSKADNNFIEDGSPLKGTVPYAERPQITRSDYVFNSNDSYWLSSPTAPLTGFSPLYGPTGTERSLRTRQNIMHLEDAAARGEDGKWSITEIQDQILSNKSLAATLFLPELIEVCNANDSIDSSACDALKGYDGHLNIDSKGAVLFREWVFAYNGFAGQAGKSPFTAPFRTDNPVNTPNGLGDREIALTALEAAIGTLNTALIPLDAALGDVQVAMRSEHRVPMHGGFWREGVANLIDQRPNDTTGPYPTGTPYQTQSGLSDKGYLVSGGTSFIMTLEFTGDGPNAEAFLTYGQSGTPANDNYSNQTKLFSEKKWRKIYFKPEDVKANAVEAFTLEGN